MRRNRLRRKRAVGVRCAKRGTRRCIEVRAAKEVNFGRGAAPTTRRKLSVSRGSDRRKKWGGQLLASLGIAVRHAFPASVRDCMTLRPRSSPRSKTSRPSTNAVAASVFAVEAIKWASDAARSAVRCRRPMVYCFWQPGRDHRELRSAVDVLRTTRAPGGRGHGQLETSRASTGRNPAHRPEAAAMSAPLKPSFEPPIIQTINPGRALDQPHRRLRHSWRGLLNRIPLAPLYAHEDFPGPDGRPTDEFLASGTQRGPRVHHP